MSAIQISQEHSPILLIKFKGVAGDDEFDVFLDVLSSFLDTQRRYAYVFDASESGLTPASQQRRMGLWMKANRDAIKLHSVGCSFVFTSPVFRFVLSAIFMIQPMPIPYMVCSSTIDGLTWASNQLRAIGVSAPTPRRRASSPLLLRADSTSMKMADRRG